MRRNLRHSKFARMFLSGLAIVLVSFSSIPVPLPLLNACSVAYAEEVAAREEKKTELTFSLAEGKEKIERPVAIPTAPARDLTAQRIQEILKRLSPIDAVNNKAFVLPEDSLVRPRLPGIQTQEKFPPDVEITRPERPSIEPPKMPLKVVRISHSGVVDTVPQLSMSFNQPVVPVSEARAVETIPFIQMTPQPKGKWKWAGTQTALFDPEGGRLPKSTVYKIKVPAGTESVNGARSSDEQSYTITTPTVTVRSFNPPAGQPQVAAPVLVAVFDQAIDRKAVLKHIKIAVDGTAYNARLVDDAKIEKDGERKFIVASLPKNQWIAFEPVTPLPLGRTARVSFLPGLPSSEGPLKTSAEQVFEVSIHGPLKLIHSPENGISAERYSWKQFGFSNPINTAKEKWKESMVKISPAVDMDVQPSGSYISLAGRMKPFTKYTVTFDRNICDIFGQSLGKNVSVSFTTGALSTTLSDLGPLNTIPLGGKPSVRFNAQATPQVKVTICRVTPNDWLQYAQNRYQEELRIGQVIATKNYKVGDEDVMIDVDLSSYLKNGSGQFLLIAQTQGTSRENARRFSSWVQVTNIGLDVFKGKDLLTLATSLSNGTALSDVEVSILPSTEHGDTDAAGLTKLPVTSSHSNSEMVVGRKGGDVAILPSSMYRGGWAYEAPLSQLKWYTVTDRQLYKPGEKVSVKGWARGLYFQSGETIQLFSPALSAVSYTMTGYDGKELAKGEAKVDEAGGFSFEATIPEKINLGDAWISLTAKAERSVQFPGSKQAVLLTDYIRDGSTSSSLPIKIQEFRRPEFEMKVASSAGASMVLGADTNLTATTQYYAGGVLPNARINWSVSASKTAYSPPGWSDFTFGHSLPFWFERHFSPRIPFQAVEQVKTLAGFTDGAGKHTVNLKPETLQEPLPVSFRCEATVNDVNRQSWSDNTSILVHPAANYVGLKPSKWFYKKGEAVELQVVATDLDGKVKPGSRVALKLLRTDKDGNEIEVTRQEITAGDHAQKVSLMPTKGGQHYVVATVFDAKERKNLTRISTYVEGDTPAEMQKAQMQNLIVIPDKKEYKPGEQAEIMVSSPFYPAHGILTLRRNTIVSTIPFDLETSSKTIKFPITKEHYPNLTVEAYVTGKDYTFASGSIELKVPPRARTLSLTAAAAQSELPPGSDTTIEIDLKNADGKPVANGQVALAVADESVLALAGYKWPDPIEVFYPPSAPAVESAYGRQYVLIPEKKDEKAQQPARPRFVRYQGLRGEVAAAPPSSVPMGRAFGEAESARDMNMFQAAPTVIDERHFSTGRAMRKSSAMAEAADGLEEEQKQITLRTNFAAMALFVPAVVTDASGKAQVKLHLPDSLTRYRIMAAAVVGDDSFGSTESNVTARLPLMAKPSAPRFLHFGDKCELPVVLHNQTEEAMKVEIVVRASNVQFNNIAQGRTDRLPGQGESVDGVAKPEQGRIDSAGKVIEVPANNRVEVRFPLATIDEGNANFQCAAVSGGISDAANFTIPVKVPASIESFAAYGQIDKGGILQKLDTPADVFEQVGGLSLTTSSTAVQALTDAYIYLKDYDYACSEQISSRMIAMLSLKNILVAFGKMDTGEQSLFDARVKSDIEQLVKRQNSDGSFGLWTTGEQRRWPYVSIQVAQALSLAQEKDYLVDAQVIARAKRYLKEIESHIPSEYDERTKIAIIARALNTRYLLKDSDPNAARRLIKRALRPSAKSSSKDKDNQRLPLSAKAADRIDEELSLECAGWLLPIVSKDADSSEEVKMIRRMIDSNIKETASTASTNDRGYGGWGYCIFYSPRRTDAIVLEALMVDQPDSLLIPKLVKGLLAHRKNGKWSGTQENGYILQALDKYFGKYEKETPNFESQAWLGDTLVGLQKFVGRSAESKIVSVPMAYLAKHKDKEIQINKEGQGRLYYRIGLDYAPKNLNLKAADFGFTVERTYEPVDDPSDVKRDPDGTWHFKSGSTVRAKLKFTAPGARYHVAMMDPLPAGAEPVNPDLSGSRTQYPGQDNPDQPGYPIPLLKSIHRPSIWWWPSSWYEHQNLRDHQAEAFQSLLYAGQYDYTYMVRATTPGDYIVPPTKVEEMYQPETFGRSKSDHVIIE